MCAMSSAFSFAVRRIECSGCGAPISAALEGGKVVCEYCGAELIIEGRPSDARVPTEIDEPSRLAGLRGQETAAKEHSLLAPPGDLAPFARIAFADATRAAGIEGLRKAWVKLHRNPVSLEASRRLCPLAVTLSAAYRDAGDDDRARAVLETTLARLSDAEHRDVIRCRLARAAALSGDPESAEAWLGEVDPRPLILELDGERRIAQAAIALARGRHEVVLRALPVDAPRARRLRQSFFLYRASAQLMAGSRKAAVREISMALGGAAADMPPIQREWASLLATDPSLVSEARSFATRTLIGHMALIVGVPLALLLLLIAALEQC